MEIQAIKSSALQETWGPQSQSSYEGGRKSNLTRQSEVDQRRQDDFDGKRSLGIGGDRAGTPKEGRVRDRSVCELTWGPGAVKEWG